LEIHYTPKHGSWLDMAEIEWIVFTKQGLSRRIADIETLRREAKAWGERRNAEQTGVDWHFTTADARVKLKRLYPQIETELGTGTPEQKSSELLRSGDPRLGLIGPREWLGHGFVEVADEVADLVGQILLV
jgi:hypothetical protein